MIRAAIFDRDGVLTYFDVARLRNFFGPLVPLELEDLAARWQKWCETGVPPRTLAEETAFWSTFWDDLALELGLCTSARDVLHAFDYAEFLGAFPDARRALARARSCGLKVGVLSNFPLASLDASLRAVGLSDLIDVACSASVIGAPKPSAESYLTVAHELGVGPEECLFFDDETPCVAGARRAGLDAYLVDRTGEHHSFTDHHVRDLDALRYLIEEPSSKE